MEIPEEVRKYSTPIDIEGICAKEPNLVKRYVLRQQLEKQETERQQKWAAWKSKQVTFK